MTVKELIIELQKFPEDAEIITEGCDCVGDSNSVEWFDQVENKIIINRS